jgi:hypothetical protein
VNATNVMSAIDMSLNCATAKAVAVPRIATAPAALMAGAMETRLGLKSAIWMYESGHDLCPLDWNGSVRSWIDRTPALCWRKRAMYVKGFTFEVFLAPAAGVYSHF